MKISYQLLQTYFEHPLPAPEVLAEKFTFHLCEVESVETLPSGDILFDLAILPDRASDCLSHEGIAREISILCMLPMKSRTHHTHETISASLEIINHTTTLRRFLGRKILYIQDKKTPAWLVQALESLGQKSIHPIVDCANYVMYMTGQPIHVYDAHKIISFPAGSGEGMEIGETSIEIRPAHDGEVFESLSGETYTLDTSMTVIADASQILALAGIKGGAHAQVTTETEHIIIEVASFDPQSIRKTARSLNLLTDAAKRFENNVPPERAIEAMHLMTDLVISLCGGQPEFIQEVFPHPTPKVAMTLTRDYIEGALGISVTHSQISDILARTTYLYIYDDHTKKYTIDIPWYRPDVKGPHDMVEEFGRILGYDTIVPRPLSFDRTVTHDPLFQKIYAVQSHLWEQGYREIMTYTLVKKGFYEVARALKGKEMLRTSLAPQFEEAYKKNHERKDVLGIIDLKLFEIGTIFTKEGEGIHVVYHDGKKLHEYTLDEYCTVHQLAPESVRFEPYHGGSHTFTAWSPYPSMSRDIAVWLPAGTDPQALFALLEVLGGVLLIQKPFLFDTFTKEDRTSYAYRLVFQSHEETLTEQIVDTIMQKINDAIGHHSGWEIR
jgi:phenylalanyl-tRNA synthetase beta chain